MTDQWTALAVLVGGGVTFTAIGFAATGSAIYRASTKELIKEGIDPSIRNKHLPKALRTLGLATLGISCLGLLGFAGISAGLQALQERGITEDWVRGKMQHRAKAHF